jgi:SPP1 gp7 family putative phage head morphogenesis protein
MEFVNTKKLTREDILGVFGVPPSMVGVFEYANYANTKEQQKIFWQNTMMPKLSKMEAVINSFLVQPYDPNLICKFDYSGIEALHEDQKLKAEVDEILTRSGIKVINEVREDRKLTPVRWGDVWNAPMMLMPIMSPRPEAGPEKPPQEEEEGKGTTHIKPQAVKTSEPDEISEEDRAKAIRDKIWAYFKAGTEAWERKFKPILRDLFTGQEREAIRNLRDSDWKANPLARILPKMDYTGKDRISVLLFSLKEANRIFRQSGKPIISGALEDKAKIEIDRLGLGIDFDVSNPAVQAWISDKTFKFANEVNKETLSVLRDELREAISTGEGIKEAEKRIERVFDMARGYRTERIARTEIISAYNNGAMEAYEQSGVVEEKEWISSRDADVRPSHQIDGEQVGLGEQFSNGLEYPGDPAGQPEEVINCRCTITGVIKR